MPFWLWERAKNGLSLIERCRLPSPTPAVGHVTTPDRHLAAEHVRNLGGMAISGNMADGSFVFALNPFAEHLLHAASDPEHGGHVHGEAIGYFGAR
jgi:hypothetical protein